jgi:hypothetical protein
MFGSIHANSLHCEAAAEVLVRADRLACPYHRSNVMLEHDPAPMHTAQSRRFHFGFLRP